jgi:hypothetical protein
MKRNRTFTAALLSAVFLAGGVAMVATAPVAWAKQEAPKLSPEVGKPLQAAQELIKQKKYKEAAAKIEEAAAAPKKSPYEEFIIQEMGLNVYLGTQDYPKAIRALESTIASGQLDQADVQKRTLMLTQLYYQTKNYPKAIEYGNKVVAAGGGNEDLYTLLTQASYLQNDYPNCAKTARTAIANIEKNGKKPDENVFQLWLVCENKSNNTAGYIEGLQKVVRAYPKREYWTDLITFTQRKQGFADRLTLDADRLMLATGGYTKPGDYMEMAQLALQQVLPGEARTVVEKGYQAKVLGEGSDVARQQRLRDLANKQAAEDQKTLPQTEKEAAAKPDGLPLFKVGEAYASYGQFDKGIPLMQQGLQKGIAKNSDDYKLKLGYWQIQAGQKGPALETLKGVKGSDGTADLARLWTIYLQTGGAKTAAN